ncbi:MAG: glutamate--tRNA ligase family protein [Acidobacteriota bacterium]|nr:glutamate--tRNA ligase family protein [Acidobacteriota bacterium]
MITRFAPAPTGFLHLGHVVNALHVWQAAHDRDGRVLLRIEDHDRQRSRPEYEAAILEDLAWLGFRHDGPIVRQSEREAIYGKAIQPLIDRELVYGCSCTRAELAAGVGSRESGVEVPYRNTCRDRDIPLTDDVGWRLRIDPGTESFFDEINGPQVQEPSAQCGDLLLRDRLGNWTYQFAVTVDDHVQQVTDVIRGIDLLASTGRQIRLARLLGRVTMPRFAHHGLVMKSATEKLSKSDGDTGVGDLRAAGWTAEAVLDLARKSVTLPL